MNDALTGSRDEGLAAIVARELPYLRRYARALTGNQAAGDGVATLMLESLIQDPNLFDRSIAPRVAVYRAFHVVWRDNVEDATTAESRTARHLMLLTTIEAFSLTDAATILELSDADVTKLLPIANETQRSVSDSRVMIIEDEFVIAMDLQMIVGGLGLSVTGVADTHTSAVELARREKPDLILADIQLADGSSGVEAVAEILYSIDVPVIFITAYPERLLTGRKAEPTFLITKPYRENDVCAAISQVLFHNPSQREAA